MAESVSLEYWAHKLFNKRYESCTDEQANAVQAAIRTILLEEADNAKA
jgi:hypothetical protein